MGVPVTSALNPSVASRRLLIGQLLIDLPDYLVRVSADNRTFMNYTLLPFFA